MPVLDGLEEQPSHCAFSSERTRLSHIPWAPNRPWPFPCAAVFSWRGRSPLLLRGGRPGFRLCFPRLCLPAACPSASVVSPARAHPVLDAEGLVPLRSFSPQSLPSLALEWRRPQSLVLGPSPRLTPEVTLGVLSPAHVHVPSVVSASAGTELSGLKQQTGQYPSHSSRGWMPETQVLAGPRSLLWVGSVPSLPAAGGDARPPPPTPRALDLCLCCPTVVSLRVRITLPKCVCVQTSLWKWTRHLMKPTLRTSS